MATLPNPIAQLKIWLAPAGIVIADLAVLRRSRLRGSALMKVWMVACTSSASGIWCYALFRSSVEINCVDLTHVRAELSLAVAFSSHHDWARPTALLRLNHPLPQHVLHLPVHFFLHFIRHWIMPLLNWPRFSHFYFVLDPFYTAQSWWQHARSVASTDDGSVIKLATSSST